MVFITKQEIEKMKNTIIDFGTMMTEYDLFENQHCYEDWQVIQGKGGKSPHLMKKPIDTKQKL